MVARKFKFNFWLRSLQKIMVAGIASVPVTVWAPNDIVRSDILEVVIEYRILPTGGSVVSEAQAQTVTNFLNQRFLDRGIRFIPAYVDSSETALAKLPESAGRSQVLAAAEKFRQPGRITVLISQQAPTSAAYLGQPLAEGPIVVYNGGSGTMGLAREVGHVFGFTKVCDVANNIMFAFCAGHSGKRKLVSFDWSYFTADPVSQTFTQQLHIWKWEASNYVLSKRNLTVVGRSDLSTNADSMQGRM